MNSGLRWVTDESPSQQTRARRWLERHRLVRRFNARSLIEHVRDAVRGSDRESLLRAALSFVFRLQLAKPDGRLSGLDQIGLQVPLAEGGWCLAQDALFSTGWIDTAGGQVQALVGAAGGVSDELAALRSRLLASPKEIVRNGDDAREWVGFLRRIGVKDWLSPVPMAFGPASLYGNQITGPGLAAFMGVPDELRDQWLAHFNRRDSRARFPWTPYVPKATGFRLPGQADHARLPARGKRVYAELLIRGLAAWPDACLRTVFVRDRPGDKDEQSVPTLVWAFLAGADWLEVRGPAENPSEFTGLPKAWIIADEDDDSARRFAPLVAAPMRRLILASPRVLDRVKWAGLGVWGEPSHAGRLVWHHGRLLADGLVPDLEVGAFRRSYRAAWARLTALPAKSLPGRPKPRYLIVERGERLATIAVDSGSPVGSVYLSDLEEASTSGYRMIRELGLPVLALHADVQVAARLLTEGAGLTVRTAADAGAKVVLDGEQFTPGADLLVLTDDLCPWLPTLVGLIIEHRAPFLRLVEKGFQETMARLRRVRMARATDISVVIDNQPFLIPARLRAAFPVADHEFPTLVLPQSPVRLGWADLKRIVGAVCELIRRPQLSESLRLAVMELDQAGVDVGRGPDLDELASVFALTPHEVRDVWRRVNGATASLVYRIYPVIVHLCGRAAAGVLDPEETSVGDEQTLLNVLRGLDLPDGVQADLVLRAAMDSETLYDLRARLRIEFGDFNRTLDKLRPAYAPQLLHEAHLEAFRFFVASERPSILNRLRAARLRRFDRFEPQPDWPALHTFSGLEPDDAWLFEYEAPPKKLMEARVQAWLAEHRAHDVAEAPDPQLPSIDIVQEANRSFVQQHVARIAVAVSAWTTAQNLAVPALWHDQTIAASRIVEILDLAGALDFRHLDEGLLIGWLAALGHWPGSMPRTLDAATLGLCTQTLKQATDAANQERLERARQRRIVVMDGTEVTVEGGDYQHLYERLKSTVGDSDPFPDRSTRFTPLAELADRPPTPRGDAARGYGRYDADRSMSPEQRQAVGFIGEWLSYQWLCHRYPTMSPEGWISSYRRHVFPGPLGDDDLGYDFRVVTARELFFEVKATVGEFGEFELGESEVREAQRNARGDRWRLLVISHVLESGRRALEVLPNPFSARGRGRFRLIGRGLRYRYTPPAG